MTTKGIPVPNNFRGAIYTRLTKVHVSERVPYLVIHTDYKSRLIPPASDPGRDPKSDVGVNHSRERKKIFPEAAAVANGNKQFDDSNDSSDDSEDHDYNPDTPEVGIEDQEEGSSSEESDSVSLSEEAPESPRHNNFNDLGLPSDDSEDDDYDPECPDPDKDVQKEGSDSNESDFTSDSDEFCVELSKSTNTNEVSSFSLSEPKLLDGSCEGRDEIHESPINAKPSPVMEGEPGQANTFPVSKKRELEHLDYEKLSDVSILT
ncbi:hypothetical protein GW17_00049521 [Ensete ventricosum]|nr:hypothetical protein GW17_00049521 [Ensete ventricosum]